MILFLFSLFGIARSEDTAAQHFLFAYYPGLHKLSMEVNLQDYPNPQAIKGVKEVAYRIQTGPGQREVKGLIFLNRDGRGEKVIALPALQDGRYEIEFKAAGSDPLIVVKKYFKEKIFKWENNRLGITDKVYPPFKPIEVEGKNVKVVLRTYRMNNFGLWDKVISEGKDILAGPITLQYTTEQGKGNWQDGAGKFVKVRKNEVIYVSRMIAAAVKVASRSTIYW